MRSRLIIALVALLVVLSGTVMFMIGRTSADGEPDAFDPPTNESVAAAPAGNSDSATGGSDPIATPAPTAPAASDQNPRTIPAAFQGEWNVEPDHCGTGLNDSALKIEPEVMRFYESRGDVARVTRAGDDSVDVEARFEGEGETWTETVRMTLSPSGDQLTTGDGTVRRRCRQVN